MADPQPLLSKAERSCLDAIAGASGRQTAVSGDACCTKAIIRRLASLGLIEVVTDLWLPLEKQHKSLRLTAAGRKLLESTKN